ncbi:hypothetical protein ACS0TY_035474 [Phlomoides rotata]
MRVRDLKDSWRTFNDILQFSGVSWDKATNIMHVPPEIFTTLVMVWKASSILHSMRTN